MIETKTENGLKIKEVNGQAHFSAILELEDKTEIPIWVPFLYQQEELNTQSQETLNKDVDKMAQKFFVRPTPRYNRDFLRKCLLGLHGDEGVKAKEK